MAKQRSYGWSRQRPLTAALMWALITLLAALTLSPLIRDTQLRNIVYAGAVILFFGGFLGGMLKVLLDEVVAAKRRREDAAEFVANVLRDLKSVYDRVARARILIPAHKSVNTYGEELRDMIEAQVQLRNVTRALERPAEGVDETTREKAIERVKQMEEYLITLTLEFRDNYKSLSDRQRGYEERAKAKLKRFAETETDEDPPELPKFVWEHISNLDKLSDFIGERSAYKTRFVGSLDDASALLRDEHARILRNSPARRFCGQTAHPDLRNNAS
jgi:hypothetical protein